MVLRRVDLPAPLSPRMTVKAPAGMLRLTSWKAVLSL